MPKQLDNGKVLCEQCGKDFKRIGSHWSGNKQCSHPEISTKKKDILIGLLMGDGWVGGKEYTYQRIETEMVSPKYLEYVDDKLSWLSTGVSFHADSEQQAKNATRGGLDTDAKSENYSDIYCLRTRSHPFISELNEWYSTGSKVWPEDIELTPTVLKHWYCGDGHYRNDEKHSHIVISMANEIDNTDKVTNYFSEVGLPEPSNYDGGNGHCNVRWTATDSKKLFEYMGNPLPDFEYKWPETSNNNCPKCDQSTLYKRHCKVVCQQCGVIYDCSDPFR